MYDKLTDDKIIHLSNNLSSTLIHRGTRVYISLAIDAETFKCYSFKNQSDCPISIIRRF